MTLKRGAVTSDDLLRLLFRAIHLIAAAVWLGGLVMGARVDSEGGDPEASALYWWRFRSLAQLAVWALLLTGAGLAFDRLATPRAATVPYFLLLSAKIAGSLALFASALALPRRLPRPVSPEAVPVPSTQHLRLLLGGGILLFLLGTSLTLLFERGLRG